MRRGRSSQREGEAYLYPIAARHGLAITNGLIAVWTLLSFLTLMAVSGPHLVHHLSDLSAGHSHSHTDQPQSTDCLVLVLMQSTPLVADILPPLPVPFLTAEQASRELQWQAIKPRGLTLQARSPPIESHL
jgi:hypothetical protein